MKKKLYIFLILIIQIGILTGIVFYTRWPKETTKNQKEKDILSHLQLPSHYRISIFSNLYGSPRDITVSPGGTILASLTDKGSVVALPDKDNNGSSETIQTVINGLVKPHGIAFYANKLYIAEFDRVVRYNWDEKTFKATNGEIIVTLPNIRGHINRSIVFNEEGKLFISLGSSCNACIEEDPRLGTVMSTDKDGNNLRIYAAGLRNAAFLAIHPYTQTLWATEMGQDRLGDLFPPDEINILRDGNHYGWPYCNGNNLHDNDVDPLYQYSCTDTIAPVFEIFPHSAPLGLTFIASAQFPAEWQNDLLVAYHGSWDRIPPVGYKIVHLRIKDNKIIGQNDFITGFIPKDAKTRTEALGRPVDLTFDKKGVLYISDDYKNVIYRVVKQ